MLVVTAQLCCTSIWFAGNAVMPDLVAGAGLDARMLGPLTSAVLFGFITGTFVFAALAVSDRFPPSRVFFLSALGGAACNALLALDVLHPQRVLLFRFMTGFFLAGIYPVGMKIASDYYRERLDRALGLLVGALVVGTALPHWFRSLAAALPWQQVVYGTSATALAGGLAVAWWVPTGPYRQAARAFRPSALPSLFASRSFRSAAFGYFGHMWELYAFWTFVPALVRLSLSDPDPGVGTLSLLSFAIIAAGGPACVAGGLLARKTGGRRVAAGALAVSGLCCLVVPWCFGQLPEAVMVALLLLWGMAVVADSPLFSSMVAAASPPDMRGTALTLVNGIGFSITIAGVQLMNAVYGRGHDPRMFILLAIGPAAGLAAMAMNRKRNE